MTTDFALDAALAEAEKRARAADARFVVWCGTLDGDAGYCVAALFEPAPDWMAAARILYTVMPNGDRVAR